MGEIEWEDLVWYAANYQYEDAEAKKVADEIKLKNKVGR